MDVIFFRHFFLYEGGAAISSATFDGKTYLSFSKGWAGVLTGLEPGLVKMDLLTPVSDDDNPAKEGKHCWVRIKSDGPTNFISAGVRWHSAGNAGDVAGCEGVTQHVILSEKNNPTWTIEAISKDPLGFSDAFLTELKKIGVFQQIEANCSFNIAGAYEGGRTVVHKYISSKMAAKIPQLKGRVIFRPGINVTDPQTLAIAAKSTDENHICQGQSQMRPDYPTIVTSALLKIKALKNPKYAGGAYTLSKKYICVNFVKGVTIDNIRTFKAGTVLFASPLAQSVQKDSEGKPLFTRPNLASLFLPTDASDTMSNRIQPDLALSSPTEQDPVQKTGVTKDNKDAFQAHKKEVNLTQFAFRNPHNTIS